MYNSKLKKTQLDTEKVENPRENTWYQHQSSINIQAKNINIQAQIQKKKSKIPSIITNTRGKTETEKEKEIHKLRNTPFTVFRCLLRTHTRARSEKRELTAWTKLSKNI